MQVESRKRIVEKQLCSCPQRDCPKMATGIFLLGALICPLFVSGGTTRGGVEIAAAWQVSLREQRLWHRIWRWVCISLCVNKFQGFGNFVACGFKTPVCSFTHQEREVSNDLKQRFRKQRLVVQGHPRCGHRPTFTRWRRQSSAQRQHVFTQQCRQQVRAG